MKLNLGKDLYIKGRIGWRGLSKDEYLENSEYRIINATALEDGYVNLNKCGYISKERYDESPEIMLKENDILISKDGTLGKIGYVKNLHSPCTVASGIFVLRNTTDFLNFDYLYHVLKSNIFKNFIFRNKALGSTINHLYQRDLENFEIELPDLETQNKIANILNELDEKIEINNQINSELESLAKTIYDYWFLQFEFPNEEGNPYKSSGGKMVWNKELKREFPDGWKSLKLKDIESNIVTGKTPSTKDDSNFNGSIPFITIGDIRNYLYILKTEQTLTDKGANSQKNKFIPENSICVSCIATPGLIGITSKESQTNQQINSIVIKNTFNRIFLLFSLQNYFKFNGGAKTGNTFKNMNKGEFENIPILYPDIDVLIEFNEKISNLFEQIKNNSEQNQELESLRDFLLPLLMNGQVSFKEGEENA